MVEQGSERSTKRLVMGLGVLGVLGLAVAACFWFGARWVWGEIQRQALEQGVELAACEVELGLSQITLEACELRVLDRSVAAVPGVSVSGSVQRIEIELASFAPRRLRLIGAALVATGRPHLADAPAGAFTRSSLPIDVQASSVAWSLEPGAAPLASLRDIRYDSDREVLHAELDAGPKASGRLALEAGELSIAWGEPEAPRARLRLRRDVERAQLHLDLARFPLRDLSGPWLTLADTLVAVEVDGQISFSIPLTLAASAAGGDIYLTLHGLAFPVPRELAGLVHASPPRLSGAFAVNRAFSELRFEALQLITGALSMSGPAVLRLEQGAVAFEAQLAGALSCTTLFDSAVAAHSDSPLARWAQKLGRQALQGSVQILSVVSGRTPALERARVITTISPGCGLRPLPVPRELNRLLENLAEKLPKRLPELMLPPWPELPSLRRPQSSAGGTGSSAPAPEPSRGRPQSGQSPPGHPL